MGGMKTKTKRIVVAFRLAGEPGRRKLGGLFRYLSEHNLDWRLQFVRIREDFSAEFVRSFAERGIDGVIYSMPAARDGAAELAKLDIPTVAVDIFDDTALRSRTRNLSYVFSSPEDVGRAAARHLLAQGVFRSYAFVPDLYANAWSRLRGKAFAEEIAAAGFKTHVYHVRGHGYDLPRLAGWLKALAHPTGVFAAFDDRAVQVLEACSEAHLRVPQDVAVLGVDNDEVLCAHTTPALTSVQPDHDRIGYLAAERLAALLDGRRRSAPERHLVPVKEIVVRESTCAVSSSGRLVQRALAFIHANANKAIKPRDVVAHLRVSRRLADLRFRELQGESLGDTIRHCRLEEVRRRLIGTNDTIENIANDCHFAKLCRLSEAFAADYGCSMGQYRETHRGRLKIDQPGKESPPSTMTVEPVM